MDLALPTIHQSLITIHFPLFPHRGCFLALAGAKIVELRPPGPPFLLDFDFGNARRMNGEHALDTFAVGNPADGKGFVQAAAFAADDDAGKNLDAFLVPFHHASVHSNAVADLELRGVCLELFLLNSVDNPVHNESSRGRWRGETFSQASAECKFLSCSC